MKKVYYFAYGSNLLSERLRFRIDTAVKYANYRLYGYKLAFNAGMFSSCFANIVPGLPTDFVEGVLYDINASQLAELDRYEALYQKEFFIAPDGNIAAVYLATSTITKKTTKPTLDYINIILAGCKEHDLTYTYDLVLAYKKSHYRLRAKGTPAPPRLNLRFKPPIKQFY